MQSACTVVAEILYIASVAICMSSSKLATSYHAMQQAQGILGRWGRGQDMLQHLVQVQSDL